MPLENPRPCSPRMILGSLPPSAGEAGPPNRWQGRAVRLPLKSNWFLDLGGGPGSYAIALAKRYPRLKGVVMDQNVAIARQLIRKSGLEARLKVKAGSILTDALGSGYDAVLISNVLHV